MHVSYANSIIHYELEEIAPIASKIVSNQHVWQEKYLITSRHQDLRRNPLRGKTTGGDEQAMHYEDEGTWWWPTNRGEAPNPRTNCTRAFSIQWI
jgi:hypothetical protein